MDYDNFYDDFKIDYLNPNVKMEDLLTKYGISRNRYNTLRKRIFEDTGVKNKPKNNGRYCSSRRYIHLKKDQYCIIKTVNGKRVYYGSYRSLNVALKVRDMLVDAGWNKDMLDSIREWVLFEEKCGRI